VLSAKFLDCVFKLSLNRHVAEFIVGYSLPSHLLALYMLPILCLYNHTSRVEPRTQKHL